MRKIAIVVLLGLAACGSQQERCINRSTAEVRRLQSLVAEVDGNLARGYAFEEYDVPMTSWEFCGYDHYPGRDGRVVVRSRMCLEDDYVTRRRSVPIDPQSEQRKRDALVARIKQLTPQMNAEVQACRATYPQK